VNAMELKMLQKSLYPVYYIYMAFDRDLWRSDKVSSYVKCQLTHSPALSHPLSNIGYERRRAMGQTRHGWKVGRCVGSFLRGRGI
jgi:hypothetical protein